MKIDSLKKELKKIANPKKARILQGFFKTGKGEYGEGDVFLGITVPQSRAIAVKFKNLDFVSIERLLHSKIHEERLIALLILVCKLEQTNILENVGMNENIYNFYLKNIECVNNWDLVDLSADKIIGGYLFSLGWGPVTRFLPASAPLTVRAVGSPSSHATPLFLIKLANSKNIWEKRIAIVSTYYFIKNNKFDATLKIAEILLYDKHDLIQKAVGWMLREVGKRDLPTEIKFLNKYYKTMQRTSLRYAIEKFPEKLRLNFLKK